MKTELLGQEKNVITIKVEFEVEEFAASLNKTIQELVQKVNVPGFRKGHIPRKVLEMRFGKESLYADSFEKMLPQAVEQVINDYDLEVIVPPVLKKREEIHEGEPVVCEVEFEVVPEVVLPELGDVEVKKLRTKLTDEDLEEAVETLRKNHSTLVPVERPIREGDVVSVTAVLSLAGSEETQEPQESVIDLGAPKIRSEVRNALLGKTKGEKVSVEFVLESTYQDKRVAGKKLHDDIAVDKVEERILPAMGREFYRRVLKADFDSQEAFREELKKQLLLAMEENHMQEAILLAVDQIVKKSEVEVPDVLVKRQIELLKQQDEEACKQRFDMSMGEHLSKRSIPIAFYERQVREKSKKIIRQTLVLDAIRKKFDIEVSREDLEAEILHMANVYHMRPESIKAVYYKDQDQLMRLTNELRYGKISKLLEGKIKIEDVDELPAKPPQMAEIEPAAEAVTVPEPAETPPADSETAEKGE
ncbi:MAG: trigger factor [Synergistaceae bacterium]|jgi:trigger factor|nr:trigger factor [Synergistaceae bacterium]